MHGTDFAEWGESCGALGLTVASIEAAAAAVERALTCAGPWWRTSVEHIAPFATIGQLWG